MNALRIIPFSRITIVSFLTLVLDIQPYVCFYISIGVSNSLNIVAKISTFGLLLPSSRYSAVS